MSAPPLSASVDKPARADSIDVLRGLALIAMAIFHTGWDLSFLGLIAVDLSTSDAWMMFARVIASTFLFIAGASLALATRQGIGWRAFLRRLAVIAVAAAAVTIGTRLFIGDQFVAFGILHHIAVASLVGLALIRVPIALIAALAVLVFLVPSFVRVDETGYGPAYFLGLSPSAPASVDYVPLFPWLAAGFLGIAATRLGLAFFPEGAWMRWRAQHQVFRLLALMGRWSLVIYLAHQPLILGMLMAYQALRPAVIVTVDEPAAQRFQRECRRSCEARGREAQYCAQACSCTEAALKREGLWRQTLDNTLSTDGSARLQSLARACAPAP